MYMYIIKRGFRYGIHSIISIKIKVNNNCLGAKIEKYFS